jgi:hypothetical protein
MKTYSKKNISVCMYLTELVQDRVQWHYFVKAITNLRVEEYHLIECDSMYAGIS